MISEWFLSLAAGFVTWLASLFGEWTPPEELTGAVDGVAAILGTFASLGVWVNWGVLAGCVTAAVATWLVIIVVQTVRAGVAHIPFVGGNGP